MKNLEINLKKVVYYLYTENYTVPVKEIKEDLNKWIYILCLWIRRHDMLVLPVLIYRYNSKSNCSKLFVEIGKLTHLKMKIQII